MHSNPLYDARSDKLYDEIPSNATTLVALTPPVSRIDEKCDTHFVYPIKKGQPNPEPCRKRSSHLYETRLYPPKHSIRDYEPDKEDYVAMSATDVSQSNVSIPRSPIPLNQPHSASGVSINRRTNPPFTTAKFHTGDNKPTAYFCHLEYATNV